MKHIKTYKDIRSNQPEVLTWKDVVGIGFMVMGLGVLLILMLII